MLLIAIFANRVVIDRLCLHDFLRNIVVLGRGYEGKGGWGR